MQLDVKIFLINIILDPFEKEAVATFSLNLQDERLELSMFLPEIRKFYESTDKGFLF